MHSVATPEPRSSSSSRPSNVTSSRDPDEPSGWPSAIAPPRALSRSRSSPRRRSHATTWAANASLTSHASMSATRRPVRASSFEVAGTGPSPNSDGATPAEACATTLARAVNPSRDSAGPLTTSSADAPSLNGEALPAVTTPSERNDGRSAASPSAVVAGRIVSSDVTGAPRGTGTATISRSNRPSSRARVARV